MTRRCPASFPTARPTSPPSAWFDDGTAAKMDYYLDYDGDVDVESLSCDAGERSALASA